MRLRPVLALLADKPEAAAARPGGAGGATAEGDGAAEPADGKHAARAELPAADLPTPQQCPARVPPRSVRNGTKGAVRVRDASGQPRHVTMLQLREQLRDGAPRREAHLASIHAAAQAHVVAAAAGGGAAAAPGQSHAGSGASEDDASKAVSA